MESRDEIEKMRSKKEQLKDIQKRYFKASTRFKRENIKFWQRRSNCASERKLEEFYQKKEHLLRNYQLTFTEFKEIYDRSNSNFEERTRSWVTFDTNLRKDYINLWQLFVMKLEGVNVNSPVLLGFPDLNETFDVVLPRKLERQNRVNNTGFSNSLFIFLIL